MASNSETVPAFQPADHETLARKLFRAGDALLLVEWEGHDIFATCPWCRAERVGDDLSLRGHKPDCKGDNAIYEATGLADDGSRDRRRKELLGA